VEIADLTDLIWAHGGSDRRVTGVERFTAGARKASTV
jgi:hypothetical protein